MLIQLENKRTIRVEDISREWHAIVFDCTCDKASQVTEYGSSPQFIGKIRNMLIDVHKTYTWEIIQSLTLKIYTMKAKIILLGILFFFPFTIWAQPDMKETIAVIKKNLVQSKVSLKNYSWVETTKTWIDGELKSTKENQCYYSVDGKLTKIATGNSDPVKKPGGLRGKIIENKKEELSDYIGKAMDKVKAYLPPDGESLQRIYDAGKVAIQILEPGKKFKLSFPDYLQKGDLLSISVDLAGQKLMALSVNTWIDKPEDKVSFDVTYNNLPDNTQYAAVTILLATAKNLKIEIDESGFRKGTGQ